MTGTLSRLGIAAMLMIPLPSNAAEPGHRVDSFREGQAGFYLEKAFGDLRNRCSGVVGKFDPKMSALPRHLRANDLLGLDNQVLLSDDLGLARFLRYVWPTETASKVTTVDPQRYIGELPPSLQQSILPEMDISVLEYTQNCMGSALLSAEAKGGIGAINLQAALDGESSRNDELTLVHGTFFSPLQQLLDHPEPSKRLPALLSFWDFYARQTGDAARVPGYYVSGFTGTVVAIGSREERTLRNTSKKSAKVSLPFFSAGAGGEMSYTRTARTAVSKFSILIAMDDSTKPKMKMAPVPTVETLADWFADLPIIVRNDSSAWRKNGNYVVELLLSGVPLEARTVDRWQVGLVGDSSRTGAIDIRTTSPTEETAIDTPFPIRFTITPSESWFTGTGGDGRVVHVNGEVTYRQPLRTRAGPRLTHKFTIVARTVDAYRSRAASDASTETVFYADSVKLVWKFDFGLDNIADIDVESIPVLRTTGVPCKKVGLERVLQDV